VRNRCEEGQHNDLATLFMSSSHHTIINLFSMGHAPGEPYVVHFTQGSLALFVVIYLILMSVGAGVAIPGGLFMPSIMVRLLCQARLKGCHAVVAWWHQALLWLVNPLQLCRSACHCRVSACS